MKIEFYRHNLNDDDRRAALEVMHSVFLSAGPVAARFEEKFAAYMGAGQAVALNSGTAALHLALLALGIGPGDEVITTPLTFIASVNAILYAGAAPVLADVEPATGLLDIEQAAAKITPRTKAILPVHLYGTLADMRGLRALADRHGLFIVEDSAHCIEGQRDGVRPGQLGDIACYSFYATKNLTCGEGGAISANRQSIAERVRGLRQHGMSRGAESRFQGFQHWDMLELGWKYNPNDLLCALMLPQLDRLDIQYEQRLKLAREYDRLLRPIAGVSRPAIIDKGALHLYTIWVDENIRDHLLGALQAAGIGVTVNYRAIHNLSFYQQKLRHKPEDFPQANAIGRRTISLPFYPGLTLPEQEYVAATLARLLGEAV